MTQLAVFTGDIVKSSEMETTMLDVVFENLRTGAEQIRGWDTSSVCFARFRGDGWQMAMSPHRALRGALVLRARVRAVGADTRIGIGVGDARMRGADLAAAEGPAFVASGHALDGMKRTQRLWAPDGILAVVLPLADRIATGWTEKQAQTVAALLDPAPPTQEALAQSVGRSQQMIHKQADAAGLDALLAACAAFEAG